MTEIVTHLSNFETDPLKSFVFYRRQSVILSPSCPFNGPLLALGTSVRGKHNDLKETA